MFTRIAVLALLLPTWSPAFEHQHQYQTPDGNLYWGDSPPVGSVYLGRGEPMAIPSNELYRAAKEHEQRFGTPTRGRAPTTDDVILKYGSDNTEYPEKIRRRVADLESAMNAAAADFQRAQTAERGSTSALQAEEIRATKKRKLERIDELKREYADVAQEVTAFYGGTPPPWFKTSLSCAGCP